MPTKRYDGPKTKSGQPRDSQRSKVYKSEWAMGGVDTEERFRDLDDIQRYLDKMISSAWWKRRYPEVREFRLKDGRGTRVARGWYVGYGAGRLNLPLWARNELTILHEVAHVIVESKYGRHGCPPHGREFCSILLTLVRWKMGDEAWRALKDQYRERKVKHTLTSRKRQMSEEQKQAARERLVAARAQKERK